MYFNIKNAIFIHKFFIFLPLILLCDTEKKYILALLFALLHELAHLLATKICREKPYRIYISPFGFELKIHTPTKKAEQVIVSTGPAFSIFLFFVFLLARKPFYAIPNFFLFAVNLIPATPLDGGRLLKIYLWSRFGAIRGNVILKRNNYFFATLLIVSALLFKNVWLFSIAIIILSRTRTLSASPFLRKRSDFLPLRLYYFEKNVPLTFLLRFISPYNFLGVILPYKTKVIFEWEIIEAIKTRGFATHLYDL